MKRTKKIRIFPYFKLSLFYLVCSIFCFLINFMISIPIFSSEIIEQHEMNESLFPLFSIVMPCYQRKKFISTALKSCIEYQELDRYNLSIEIIMIDDNSTDGTFHEMNSQRKRYESIKKLRNHIQFTIIQNEMHRGALYTRSIGLKTAKGKYVLSLDSDDEFVPGLFERLHLLLRNRNDIDLLQFRILVCDLREQNNNVTYDQNAQKKLYTYKLFAYIDTFPNIQKYVTFDKHINETKFHIINDGLNKTVRIDLDHRVHHASKEQFRKLVNHKKVMWNLPSLLFKRKLIQAAFDKNLLEEEVINQEVSIHEDYYISYVVFFLVRNFYFLDEIGYIYYRGTPRVKRKKNLRIISQSLARFHYSDNLPKFRI